MTVTVRPANAKTEQELLCTLLERNLTALAHRVRFRWLYLDNPAGVASSWVVEDTGTWQGIALASVFPRSVWIGERPGLCGQVGDFAVDPGYRSLGPAVMLQRATMEPVRQSTLDFCYDCPPDDRGLAPFRRLGVAPMYRMRRYVRLLRCDRQLEKRIGRNALTRVLSALGNGVLALGRRRGPDHGVEIAVHPGRFGDEFSALDRRLRERGVVRARRSAEDLNWRYREDPLHRYEVLTAHRRHELAGYAILAVAGDDALLIDLFGELPTAVTPGLLDGALDRARRAGCQTLQVLCGDDSALAEHLTYAGFRQRSHGPHVVAYARAGTDAWALLHSPPSWLVRHADIMA
jgi:hypothetical protein